MTYQRLLFALAATALLLIFGPGLLAEEKPMRKLEELINKEDPGWPLVQEWMADAKNKVEVLPPIDDKTREGALVATQVTTRSPMGAIVYESGGILVDHGWLRLLGSGSPRLPRSLPGFNQSVAGGAATQGFLLVADDVLGGFFAVDGGGLGIKPGQVAYFSPASLKWEGLGVGFSDFLVWCFQGNLEEFYSEQRWPGWKEDIAKLSGDQAYSIYPPLWAKEGGPIEKRSRKAVPVMEIYSLNVELSKQLKKD